MLSQTTFFKVGILQLIQQVAGQTPSRHGLEIQQSEICACDAEACSWVSPEGA